MNSSNSPLHWQLPHVICCLYYLVASSDFIIKEEEELVIDRHLDNFLILHCPELYVQKHKLADEVAKYVDSANDLQKMEAVRYFSTKFLLNHDIYFGLIKSLEEIAQADRYISIEEHSMMYYIRLKFKVNTNQLVHT